MHILIIANRHLYSIKLDPVIILKLVEINLTQTNSLSSEINDPYLPQIFGIYSSAFHRFREISESATEFA